MAEWTATPSADRPEMFVLRGGGYAPDNGMAKPHDGLRTWQEHWNPPDRAGDHMGIRCAVTAP
jgi:formylglycine-generating enzyme required for sulfatase activity